MGAGGLKPPLPLKTPWKIEARRREKKGKERREEEERWGWRKKKGDEPPKGQIVDPPLPIKQLASLRVYAFCLSLQRASGIIGWNGWQHPKVHCLADMYYKGQLMVLLL